MDPITNKYNKIQSKHNSRQFTKYTKLLSLLKEKEIKTQVSLSSLHQ
jgi:hypothetical protein